MRRSTSKGRMLGSDERGDGFSDLPRLRFLSLFLIAWSAAEEDKRLASDRARAFVYELSPAFNCLGE
jgi:hypothetical protein